MPRRKPRKPTGWVGHIKLESGESSETTPATRVPFQESKEEVELTIARGFALLARHAGFLPKAGAELVQNDTDDLDFSLVSGKQVVRYLELTEFAPHAGAPHADSLSVDCVVGDVAFAIGRQIWTKSERYRAATPIPIDLVVYTTDWRFAPVHPIPEILLHRLPGALAFDRVFLYTPAGEAMGVVTQVYSAESRPTSPYDPRCENLIMRILNISRMNEMWP